MAVAGQVLVLVVGDLTASLVNPRGGRDGDRLSGHHDVRDRLDDDDLLDYVAVGNVVGADKLISLGDRRVRRGRGRSGSRGRGRGRGRSGGGLSLRARGRLLLEHATR